jgi:hypothetical protein
MAEPPPPLTQAEIQQQVEAQVQAEIEAAIGPLQGQIGGERKQEQYTVGQIGQEFGSLMPFVQQSSQAVTNEYNKSMQAQKGIFQNAQMAINNLANSRAAAAQELAQKMGGPVAVGEFTAPVDPYSQTAPYEYAGSMLQGLSEAQAGEQQAQAWSGRVFPAMQTEQQAQARKYYEDRVSTLQDEINRINSQRGSLINSRVADRLVAERTYSLQLAQQKLDALQSQRDETYRQKTLRLQKIKDDREWRLAQSTSKQERKKLKAEIAQITGYLNGKPTLAERTRRDAMTISGQKTKVALLKTRADATKAAVSLQEKITHDRAMEAAATRRGDISAAKEARQRRKDRQAQLQQIKENKAPDPARSKLRGFLVDRMGRPIKDKQGKKIKVSKTTSGVDWSAILAKAAKDAKGG